MTLFSTSRPIRKAAGWGVASLLLLSLASLVVLPSGYLIQRPGQVFNVMSQIDSRPVISSNDVPVYASESRFDVTTVSLLGNRDANPNWFQVLIAWIDPNQDVVPVDQVYPANKTTAEVRAESSAQMEISQQDAIAAALISQGYEVPRKLYVSSVIEDAPASGILIGGDFVLTAGSIEVATFEELREQIQRTEGAPIVIGVDRDGQLLEFEITPGKRDDGYFIGAMVGYTYQFPVDIELQLGEVGGPSGGLMFTLGILDTITEGSLAGANHVSGTGTISPTGEVGPIGGIRLKLIAAHQSGANLFLAPEGNCSEVIGNVPEGLQVAIVRDLSQALDAVEDLRLGNPIPAPSCNN
jgi:PDZ domain-containing protein